MQHRITLRDIAKRAKVHVTTVSLALRGHPSLPIETRARIKALARRLGYRPDPMLSALIAYRHKLTRTQNETALAYLTNYAPGEYWKEYHAHWLIYSGARERSEELGYRMEVFSLQDPGMTPSRLDQVLWTRRIAGLLIAPWPQGRGHLRMRWERYSCVKIGLSLVWPPVHTVENNQYQCMQAALRKLRGKGYHRPGFVIRATYDERVNHLWSAGFLVEGLRFMPRATVPPLKPKILIETAFRAWFQRHQPDVIMSHHLKILTWLNRMKVRVPSEVGFVDLDCSEQNRGAHAGIAQAHGSVGSMAVDLLVSMMHQGQRGIPSVPSLTLVDGQWHDGKTVGRVPRTSR